jgi:hypothetical protein
MAIVVKGKIDASTKARPDVLTRACFFAYTVAEVHPAALPEHLACAARLRRERNFGNRDTREDRAQTSRFWSLPRARDKDDSCAEAASQVQQGQQGQLSREQAGRAAEPVSYRRATAPPHTLRLNIA